MIYFYQFEHSMFKGIFMKKRLIKSLSIILASNFPHLYLQHKNGGIGRKKEEKLNANNANVLETKEKTEMVVK